MKIRVFLLFSLLLAAVSAGAEVYRLEGKIGDRFTIVIELEERDDGALTGRYAYRLTLRRNGDVACSWLSITPDREHPYSNLIIRDCKHKQVEVWSDIAFNGRYLTARMRNTAGKTYNVAATVAGLTNEPLDAYYKQHIGEMVCDMDMFNEPRIRRRLQSLMGAANYRALKEIYQTQGDIQYNNGMFWGSGFKAHQCCDPATVWAYDTDNNSFYVWIRRNDQDSWWSESGSIPIKFREIVDRTS